MKFKEYINESGYSRLMQIMSGLVPTVKTFAIITWENPMGKKSSLQFNKQANVALKDTLRHFSYKHIKGKYGTIENPFIIFNISSSQAKRLAFKNEEYKQESIVFGKRMVDKEKVGIIIKLIYHDNRRPDIRRVWSFIDKSKGDDYSEYKGRRFRIPFFDDQKHLTFKDGKKSIIEHNIYNSKYFSKQAKEKLNKMVDKLLDEDRSGRFLYENRGLLHLELNKLWTQSYSIRIKEYE